MRKQILFILSTLALLMHPLSLSADVNSATGDQAVSPDFDGNGIVDFADFLAFAGLFGARQGDGRYDARYDLDSDGAIGFSDFLIFSGSFGKEVSSPNVDIPDANLRAVIADSLGKASGAPITRAEMASLNRLEAPNKNIRDLTGLAFATNLTWLDLGTVFMSGEGFINSNEISNLAPLSGLTRLELLDLDRNSISDVSALSGLASLETLSLASNSISDLAPLVANAGLGSGDRVYVRNNPLSTTSINTHIPALESRGIGVSYSGGGGN